MRVELSPYFAYQKNTNKKSAKQIVLIMMNVKVNTKVDTSDLRSNAFPSSSAKRTATNVRQKKSISCVRSNSLEEGADINFWLHVRTLRSHGRLLKKRLRLRWTFDNKVRIFPNIIYHNFTRRKTLELLVVTFVVF